MVKRWYARVFSLCPVIKNGFKMDRCILFSLKIPPPCPRHGYRRIWNYYDNGQPGSWNYRRIPVPLLVLPYNVEAEDVFPDDYQPPFRNLYRYIVEMQMEFANIRGEIRNIDSYNGELEPWQWDSRWEMWVPTYSNVADGIDTRILFLRHFEGRETTSIERETAKQQVDLQNFIFRTLTTGK